MCGYGFTNEVDLPSPFNEAEFRAIINDTWNGIITRFTLPVSVYTKTVKNINSGVFSGFGKTLIEVEFGTPDYLMLKDLTDNVQVFSSAKTYQQTRSLTDLLKQQKLKSNFFAFEKEAKKILDDYNVNFLKAEYNTSIGSSRMAGQWARIEKDKKILPYLRYQTVGDGRVRPEHADLDNITRRVDDKFWSSFYPPNGWNCRCTVVQLADVKETDLSGLGDLEEDITPQFRMNSGKDRLIFKERGKNKHPYFKVAKGDKEFAKSNFGLPIINIDG